MTLLHDPTIWDNPQHEDLIKALLAIRNRAQAKAIFGDLFSESEIKDFANRITAAKLLHDGVSYTDINQQTGMSTATIAKTSKQLQQGSGGYHMILRELDATQDSNNQ